MASMFKHQPVASALRPLQRAVAAGLVLSGGMMAYVGARVRGDAWTRYAIGEFYLFAFVPLFPPEFAVPTDLAQELRMRRLRWLNQHRQDAALPLSESDGASLFVANHLRASYLCHAVAGVAAGFVSYRRSCANAFAKAGGIAALDAGQSSVNRLAARVAASSFGLYLATHFIAYSLISRVLSLREHCTFGRWHVEPEERHTIRVEQPPYVLAERLGELREHEPPAWAKHFSFVLGAYVGWMPLLLLQPPIVFAAARWGIAATVRQRDLALRVACMPGSRVPKSTA